MFVYIHANVECLGICNAAAFDSCIEKNTFSLLSFNGRFYTRGRIRPDELSSVVQLERRTTEDSSSGRIIRLVPVFTLETNNQTNNECLPKFVQTHNASSSIKTANDSKLNYKAT